MDNTEKRLYKVELGMESNMNAIEALTKTIDKLANVMAQEDNTIKDTLSKLMVTSAECQTRHSNVLEVLGAKKVAIKELQIEINRKVDKQDFDELRKVLNGMMMKVFWGVIGAVAVLGGSAIVFAIKQGGVG